MMDIASVTIGFFIMLGAMTLGLHIATVMFGIAFMLLVTVLLIHFEDLALWLPRKAFD